MEFDESPKASEMVEAKTAVLIVYSDDYINGRGLSKFYDGGYCSARAVEVERQEAIWRLFKEFWWGVSRNGQGYADLMGCFQKCLTPVAHGWEEKQQMGHG